MAFLFSSLVHSLDLEKGVDAYNRGDYQQAYEIFRSLTEQGNAFAQFNLGEMYYKGRGVPQNDEEALRWYRAAAEQGDENARVMLAIIEVQGMLLQSRLLDAEQGNANQQFALGKMYSEGQDVPQNYEEAVRWFRAAADQGHAHAQAELGSMYALGLGVPQNYGEAVRWLRAASEQGFAEAQFVLGGWYALGRGVPQNYVKAHKWMNISVYLGNQNDAVFRDRIAKEMTPAQIQEAQRLAQEWVNSR